MQDHITRERPRLSPTYLAARRVVRPITHAIGRRLLGGGEVPEAHHFLKVLWYGVEHREPGALELVSALGANLPIFLEQALTLYQGKRIQVCDIPGVFF